ncbi:sugar kinase [Longispora fulva]|uniref:2-dehydro-3-deoxygluconokinase n=1 Tax=Longispora fulva TaxID=619741 RepID=A0A8J7GDN1_9ACTN|nr:sugar kinase [Longispora fulva]MBG6135995.1 2-dehydro-3-deoxygluconokinase [Longispora fulva]GIG55763.1 sugar kinase [Longispora fulva]
MIDVLTYGETMAALRSTTTGPLRLGHHLAVSLAGAESTVAIGVCRLGGTARWTGVLGDDEFGLLVRDRLRAEGVLVDAIAVDRDVPTGLIVTERRTSDRHRVSYYRAGNAGSRLAPDHVHEDDLRSCRILHVTGITPALSDSAAAAVRAAVAGARRHGATVCLDVNWRSTLWPAEKAAPVLRELAGYADIVLATLDEAELLVGARPVETGGTPAGSATGWSADTDASDRAAAALAQLGPRLLVIKHGADGATGYEAGHRHHIPPHRVTVRDPLGAGDAFAAGLLADLAAGRDFHTALTTAAAVAAVAVSCDGDWEGLPTRPELAGLLAGEDILR